MARVPYCNANKQTVEPWREKNCLAMDCPWLIYMCQLDATINKRGDK